MSLDLDAVLSDPRVMEAVDRARQQVASEAGIAYEDVYYRLMNVDDWTTIPSNAAPAPGAYPITYTALQNSFTLKSVGDRFQKLVFIGFLMSGLWGQIESADMLLNGNRAGEWPGSVFQNVTGNIVIWPDGPKIIDAKCSLTFTLNFAAALPPAVANFDCPIAIVFPLCG